eukprot:TRINITY_DN142726_c0_g1_i1.p1 TRINITY_DN142726_c0_g1~~TRINITY_DN142726_c0_g1_i1.p1  ORF type:complete len:131 (-),score=5.94 TRINITY_DN142726_c0_g1_i1:161-529(-)
MGQKNSTPKLLGPESQFEYVVSRIEARTLKKLTEVQKLIIKYWFYIYYYRRQNYRRLKLQTDLIRSGIISDAKPEDVLGKSFCKLTIAVDVIFSCCIQEIEELNDTSMIIQNAHSNSFERNS